MASKLLVDELGPYSHATDVTMATGKNIAGANTQFKVTGGTSGQVLISDGAGGLTWGPVGTTIKYAVICEQQASGTNGGTFTAGSWVIRTLNNEIYDQIGVSISSNVFTIPAGTFIIRWQAPAFGVSAHMSRLYDVTNTSVVEYGSSAYDRISTANDTGLSHGWARVVVGSATEYQIEHRCGTSRSTEGLGQPVGVSVEKYTIVEIEQHS